LSPLAGLGLLQPITMKAYAFADDVALQIYNCTSTDRRNLINAIIAHIQNNLSGSQIELSQEKTKWILFSNQGVNFEEAGVIEQVRVYKYLGGFLDERLELHVWIDKICEEMNRRIHILKRVGSFHKLSRKHLTILYQGYIRSYIAYGHTVWTSALKNYAEKINTSDRTGLRMISGLLPGTSNAKLKQLSTLPELQMWLSYLVQRSKNPDLQNPFMADLRKKKKILYRNNYYEEKLIARTIANCAPTKSWALKLKLCQDDICRHCHCAKETLTHLLLECACFWTVNPLRQLFTSLQNIQDDLMFSRRHHGLFIKFIRKNSIFKRY
jgi:hypothetical protein